MNSISLKKISPLKIGFVLIGFPLVATFISLLLYKQDLITGWGLDFFHNFWILITFWYTIQIFIVGRILKNSGWSWKDIGFALNKRKILYFCLGYLIVAFGLLFFIEYSLSHATIDQQKMNTLLGLSPRDTTGRIIFIFMGLIAGISEEVVYRGFAIRSISSNKLNQWVAVFIAAIPFVLQHGIKAYQLNWSLWYFAWGILFGVIFLFTKKLNVNIIIHWLVILSALPAVLQAIVR